MDATVKIVVAYGLIGAALLLTSVAVAGPAGLALRALGGLLIGVGLLTLVWYRVRERDG
jgi:hypothetical protein